MNLNLKTFIVLIKEAIKTKKQEKIIFFSNYIYKILLSLKDSGLIKNFFVKNFFLSTKKGLIECKKIIILFKFNNEGLNIIKNIGLITKNKEYLYKKKEGEFYSTIDRKIFLTTNEGIFSEERIRNLNENRYTLFNKGGKLLFFVEL